MCDEDIFQQYIRTPDQCTGPTTLPKTYQGTVRFYEGGDPRAHAKKFYEEVACVIVGKKRIAWADYIYGELQKSPQTRPHLDKFLEAGESCGLVTANVGNSTIFFLEENRNIARVFVDLFNRGKLGQVDPHVRTMIFSLFLGYTDASIIMEMLVRDSASYAIDKGAPDDSPEFTTYSAEYYNAVVRDPTVIEKYKVKLEKAKSLIREIMDAYGKMGML